MKSVGCDKDPAFGRDELFPEDVFPDDVFPRDVFPEDIFPRSKPEDSEEVDDG